MHAWVLVWCGSETGWIGLDPTNAILASDEHVVLALGRDYTDVAPMDGVIVGSGGQQIDVAVSVTPVGESVRLYCFNSGSISMRAYQLPKGGAGIDALLTVDRPMPKPLYRQVLVKVAACSLNFRDLGIVRGTYRMPVHDNLIPLSDGAGEVVEVGAGVTRVKAGDKVAGCFFQRWPGGEIHLKLARRRSVAPSTACSPNMSCWRRKVSSKSRSTCRSRKARRCPAPA